jgi:hypothetical protein
MISAKSKYVKTYTGRKVLRCSEESEQAALISWARFNAVMYPDLNLLFHVPNGGARDKREGANLKRAGVLAGIPDLILPAARHGYHSLYIEMKVEPNKPTKSQIDVMKKLKKNGNFVIVCYGAGEARKVLNWYLGMSVWGSIKERKMKKIIICCDRCGETIDGFPMKLSVDYIKRIDGQEVYQKMPDPIRKLVADECERDYCERCMQEILEFSRMNVDAETYLSDKTGKETKDTESYLIPVEMPEQEKADAEIKSPEKPDTEQQERKRGRPPKDGAPLRTGYLTQKDREKIEQMYALGADPSEVAKEMGLPEKIVINAIANLEKLG